MRSVPMPAWAKTLVDEWTAAAGITSGRIARALKRRREIARDRMDEQDIHELVAYWGGRWVFQHCRRIISGEPSPNSPTGAGRCSSRSN